MISKTQIKHISSLHLKKNRREEKLFFVEGTKMIYELLKSSYIIHSIYALDEWEQKHSGLLKGKNIPLITVSEEELNKISALTTPQQVLALAEIPDDKMERHSLNGKLTLLLDEIKDPGNMGTIIRIADWFGIEHIICSENTVELYNPKVVQASMGSLFRVKIFYQDISSLLEGNKNTLRLPVYAAVMKGDPIYDAVLGNEGFIVLGNESEGIRKDLMPYVSNMITIPSFSDGSSHAESLNVAVAAAIVCSEFRRRN